MLPTTLAPNHLQQLNGNKSMFMKYSLVVFLLLSTLGVWSQKYAPVVTQGGKKFYTHTVAQGNTLFGLQQLYNCSAEEILNANPGIERGLNEGQLLKIPAPLKTIMHTVQKSETLFAISKMYSVPVDSIVAKNPEAQNGIKVNQRLKIENAVPRVQIDLPDTPSETITKDVPAPSDSVEARYKVTFSDSIITHTVLQGETMYTIAKRYMVPSDEIRKLNGMSNSRIQPGQNIKIPLKMEKVKTVEVRQVPDKDKPTKDSVLTFPKKEYYNIALFLPFNLDSTASYNKATVNAALEYYMGAKLALDSLERKGLKCNFYVYDYQSKTESIQQHLAKTEFKTMDLIFAPLQQTEAEIVCNWAKNNKVRCVLSVAFSAKLYQGNRYVYALNPDNDVLIRQLAKHIYDLHTNQQIVLIKSGKPEEEWMGKLFLTTFKEFPVKASRPRVIEADWSTYKNFEKIGSPVQMIVLSNDKEKVLALLERYKTSPNISVYGMRDWTDWKEVNATYANKYNFYYASGTYFDYQIPNIEAFHKLYRKNYGTDLTRTACLGYDVIMQTCSAFFFDAKEQEGLISRFSLQQAGKGNGMVNNSAFFLHFQDFNAKPE